MGRRLTGARLGFAGEVDGADVTGSLSGGGALDGLVMRLAGDLAVAGDNRTLSGLDVAIGPNRLTGEVSQTGTAPVEGRLTLDAPDIAPIADAGAGGRQRRGRRRHHARAPRTPARASRFTASARDLAVGANRIGAPRRQGQRRRRPRPAADRRDARRRATSPSPASSVASLNATAEHTDGTTMRFSADARLAIGTLADFSGELARLDGGFAATLDTLRIRQDARLGDPHRAGDRHHPRRRGRADAARRSRSATAA